jgi:hypothetical protein
MVKIEEIEEIRDIRNEIEEIQHIKHIQDVKDDIIDEVDEIQEVKDDIIDEVDEIQEVKDDIIDEDEVDEDEVDEVEDSKEIQDVKKVKSLTDSEDDDINIEIYNNEEIGKLIENLLDEKDIQDIFDENNNNQSDVEEKYKFGDWLCHFKNYTIEGCIDNINYRIPKDGTEMPKFDVKCNICTKYETFIIYCPECITNICFSCVDKLCEHSNKKEKMVVVNDVFCNVCENNSNEKLGIWYQNRKLDLDVCSNCYKNYIKPVEYGQYWIKNNIK